MRAPSVRGIHLHGVAEPGRQALQESSSSKVVQAIAVGLSSVGLLPGLQRRAAAGCCQSTWPHGCWRLPLLLPALCWAVPQEPAGHPASRRASPCHQRQLPRRSEEVLPALHSCPCHAACTGSAPGANSVQPTLQGFSPCTTGGTCCTKHAQRAQAACYFPRQVYPCIAQCAACPAACPDNSCGL